jgi:hypothetical protein
MNRGRMAPHCPQRVSGISLKYGEDPELDLDFVSRQWADSPSIATNVPLSPVLAPRFRRIPADIVKILITRRSSVCELLHT